MLGLTILAALTTLWSYEETDLELDGNPSYYREAGSPNALTSPLMTLGKVELSGEIAAFQQLPVLPVDAKAGLVWIRNDNENAFYGVALSGLDTTNSWMKLADAVSIGACESDEISAAITLARMGDLGVVRYELSEKNSATPLFSVERSVAMREDYSWKGLEIAGYADLAQFSMAMSEKDSPVTETTIRNGFNLYASLDAALVEVKDGDTLYVNDDATMTAVGAEALAATRGVSIQLAEDKILTLPSSGAYLPITLYMSGESYIRCDAGGAGVTIWNIYRDGIKEARRVVLAEALTGTGIFRNNNTYRARSMMAIAHVWTGAGEDDDWDTAANWLDGEVPTDSTGEKQCLVDVSDASVPIQVTRKVDIAGICCVKRGGEGASVIYSTEPREMALYGVTYRYQGYVPSGSELTLRNLSWVLSAVSGGDKEGAILGRGTVAFEGTVSGEIVGTPQCDYLFRNATNEEYSAVISSFTTSSADTAVKLGEGTNLHYDKLCGYRSGYCNLPKVFFLTGSKADFKNGIWVNRHHTSYPFNLYMEGGVIVSTNANGLSLGTTENPSGGANGKICGQEYFTMSGGELYIERLASEENRNYAYLNGGEIYLGAGGMVKTETHLVATIATDSKGNEIGYEANTNATIQWGGTVIHATTNQTWNLPIELAGNAIIDVPAGVTVELAATLSGGEGYTLVKRGEGDFHVKGTLTVETINVEAGRVTAATLHSVRYTTLLGVQAFIPYMDGCKYWSGAEGGLWTFTNRNWILNGEFCTFTNGDNVVIDDEAAGDTIIIPNNTVIPGELIIDIDRDFTITNSLNGRFGAATGRIVKRGTGTLNLASGTVGTWYANGGNLNHCDFIIEGGTVTSSQRMQCNTFGDSREPWTLEVKNGARLVFGAHGLTGWENTGDLIYGGKINLKVEDGGIIEFNSIVGGAGCQYFNTVEFDGGELIAGNGHNVGGMMTIHEKMVFKGEEPYVFDFNNDRSSWQRISLRPTTGEDVEFNCQTDVTFRFPIGRTSTYTGKTGIKKTGSGKLTLDFQRNELTSCPGRLDGAIKVMEGELQVNCDMNSATQTVVKAGATLSGHGKVGNVIFENGSVFDARGDLRILGDAEFQGVGTLYLESVDQKIVVTGEMKGMSALKNWRVLVGRDDPIAPPIEYSGKQLTLGQLDGELQAGGGRIPSFIMIGNGAAPSSLSPGPRLSLLAKRRAKMLNKRREIIYNTDGCDMVYYSKMSAITETAFWGQRLNWALDSEIDTISYVPLSSGFGNYSSTNTYADLFIEEVSATNSSSYNAVYDFYTNGLDCIDMAVHFSRTNGIEGVLSIRMNDSHDGTTKYKTDYYDPGTNEYYHPFFSTFKREHKDMLMWTTHEPTSKKHGQWACVDFTHSEVRNTAKNIIIDFLERRDVDGLELDFCRHFNYFKSVYDGGTASDEERGWMTQLMRDIKAAVTRLENERNHPILLYARVADSPAYCYDCGIDTATWAEEGLIDFIIGGFYFRSQDWKTTADFYHAHGIKFYASLDDSRVSSPIKGRDTVPYFRARFAETLDAGCDGVYLFNQESDSLSTVSDLRFRETDGEDKIYFVVDRSDGSWNEDHYMPGDGFKKHRKLPSIDPTWADSKANREKGYVVIVTNSFDFTMRLGDDFTKAAALGKTPEITVMAAITNNYLMTAAKYPELESPVAYFTNDAVTVSLNGTALELSERSAAHVYSFTAPSSAVIKGLNSITVGNTTDEPFQLKDFAVKIIYREDE